MISARMHPVTGLLSITAVVVLSVFAMGAQAVASSSRAELRVVTRGKNLVDARAYTDSTTVPTSPKANCFGPPGGSGTPKQVSGKNPAGLLADASRVLNRLNPFLVTDQFSFGLGICGIGGASAPSGSFSTYWEIRVDHKALTESAETFLIKPGAQVLWSLSECDPNTYECPVELDLRAPARAQPGRPFKVRVFGWTTAGERSPAAGVKVAGSEPTDADGVATVTLSKSTGSKLVARRPGAITSQTRFVCVKFNLKACRKARGKLIAGSPGRDRIRATMGDDTIIPGGGRDAVFARAGNDVIGVRGGGRDLVNCGGGRDVVNADRSDRVAGNCERVRRSGSA